MRANAAAIPRVVSTHVICCSVRAAMVARSALAEPVRALRGLAAKKLAGRSAGGFFAKGPPLVAAAGVERVEQRLSLL